MTRLILPEAELVGSVDDQGLVNVMIEGERVALVMIDPKGRPAGADPAKHRTKYSFTGKQAIKLAELLKEAGVRYSLSGKNQIPRS